jgi:Uma2 family endonuclease
MLYARFGVEHYWLVDPVEQWLEVFRVANRTMAKRVYASLGRRSRDETVTCDLFPDLTINLGDIWD